jgi:hypothetical protein
VRTLRHLEHLAERHALEPLLQRRALATRAQLRAELDG